ncbi:putative toxin secretion transmembrane protein [Marinomonas sp. MED121]|uniref:HlyD family type I secretion periplasmic adaptor subunit n=1 Tax=Marinomonas sp. MED121 TaxID=314277 RepID=UPI0000690F69|nr:HlyD family type I secretion periplasmic adaptor subunit [Marinomonas sp. MED121]EAQ67708.1 putative toxin secretion transmembrane protein [Marinomonas sp. MED121]
MANLALETSKPSLTNMSVKPSIIAGILIILVMLGGFGAWATMANLSGAILASGVVTLDSKRKTVQHLEGGIVAEILVSEGEKVDRGQLLVKLDDTRAAANLANIEAQIDVFLARLARLRSEQNLAMEISFNHIFKARRYEPVVVEMIEGQTALFKARRESLEGEITLQTQKKVQYLEQIQGLEAQIAASKKIEAISAEELVTTRKLYDNGNLTLQPVLDLEKSLAHLKGQIGEYQANIASARAGIAESDLRVLQLRIDFREAVESELLDVQAKIFELREQRIMANYEHNRVEIRAPKGGKIMDLGIHTIGGVLSPGQAILDIVPEEDELIVEARLQTQDIDKISMNQTAVVRMSAFSSRTTPELNGLVSGVSADSFIDETNGMSFYKLRIRIPQDEMEKLNELVLMPGMPAEVFVQTEARTMVSYLMKPLSDSALRAFRED